MERVRTEQARMSNLVLKIRNDTPKDFQCAVRNHCKLGYQMKLIFSAYIYLGNWPRPQTRTNATFINPKLIIFSSNPLMESVQVDKTYREHFACDKLLEKMAPTSNTESKIVFQGRS